MTACLHTIAAAGTAGPDAWAFTLEKIAQNDKHAGVGEALTGNIVMRTDSLVTTMSWEEQRSVIQIEKKVTR